jgi:flagellar FliJ protein
MNRLAMLQVLLEREQKRRDDVQAQLRAALQNVQTQQQQAEGLTTYRGEYCQKWSGQFQQAASMEILRSYHGFLSRLDQAITQQQNVIAHAERQVEAVRQRLIEREIRVATVERLMQRRRALLARADDRRDQKNMDELAQRLATRQRGNGRHA